MKQQFANCTKKSTAIYRSGNVLRSSHTGYCNFMTGMYVCIAYNAPDLVDDDTNMLEFTLQCD